MPDVLAPFLSAQSVAVIGASDDPTRIGGRPLRYLREAGYAGRVYPVNPGRDHVQGLRSVADVRDLEEVPELAIVAVGRSSVPEVLRGCADRGVKSVIIFASGFAEIGDAGRQAQDDLTALARESGMRILGPNCNGCVHPPARTTFAFTPVLADGMPNAGHVAIATQSAAIGTYWLRRMRERRIGLHSLVHTGNEADIGLPDAILSLLQRTDVGALLVGLEQWRDPPAMARVADAMRSSTSQVVVLPLGTSPDGRAAAASHTGGLVARSNNLVIGLLAEAGAVVVDDLEDALLTAASMQRKEAPLGRRVGVLTPSGGFGILLADALSDAGFELPEMPTALQREWRDAIPFASTRNPVDVTAQLVNEPALYRRFVEDMLASDLLDHLVVFLPHASREDGLTDAVARAATSGTGRVSLSVVGSVGPESEAWLRSLGVNVFATPRQAADVLRRLSSVDRRLAFDPTERPPSIGPVPRRAANAPAAADEIESKQIVAAWGVPVVDEILVSTPDDAAEAAERLGYPAVLKRVEPDVIHKADAGGVIVGLADLDAVRTAAERLMTGARAHARFAVQRHILGDEIILSVTSDPDWGLLALLGVGGTSVEEGGDVHFRTAPPTAETVTSMIGESPVLAALLQQGRRSRSIGTITRILCDLTSLVQRAEIRAVELNPVIVNPGGECVAVDALIEWANPRQAGDEGSPLHG